MVNVRLIYEQMEAGKGYLLTGSLLGFRLALILLDNVAELLMHQALASRFGFDDAFQPQWEPALSDWLRRRKYTPDERKQAEREFEPKTRILHLRLNKISSEDCIVLNTCHKLRCEAFHSGTLRERILEDVSKLLFITVVELTLKLPISGYRFPSQPLSSEDANFLERFGFTTTDMLISHQSRQQFADRLITDVSFDSSAFAGALSSDLVDRIENLIGVLEYIGETDDRSKIDRNLQYTQFWRQLGSKLMAEEIREPDLETAYRKWQVEGHAKYTLRKIDRWRRQAESIRSCLNPARALAHYSGIDKRLRPFEKDIADAAVRYDEKINAQIEDYKIQKALSQRSS